MSKFTCNCGAVIRDQTDDLPYKGYIFADPEYFPLFERITADITSFLQARLAGRERDWITRYFSTSFPCTKDEDIVYHIVSYHLMQADIDLYQCPQCGRLHVEHRDDKSRLESFAPETAPHRDIFRK